VQANDLLACSNCIPGDSSGWNLPILLAAGLAIILSGALGRLALRGVRHPRDLDALGRWVLACAVLLGAGAPTAVWLAKGPMQLGNLICGNPMAAVMTQAVPEQTLDANQTACKQAGQERIDRALWATWVAAAGGAAAVAGSVVLARRRQPDLPSVSR
jgi:hypothetical protein